MIDPIKQIIVVRKDLLTREENRMTPGKLAAQVAHASLGAILKQMPDTRMDGRYLDFDEHPYTREWLDESFRKVVLYVKSEDRLIKLYEELGKAGIIATLIKDKGLTIFSEPTVTCLGIEPLPHSVISPFVKRLQLLN